MNVANRMMQLAGTVAKKIRTDGWSNVLTGLGVAGRDKRLAMQYQWIRFTESDLEHLYATDAGARRIVEYVPSEGTREWIELRMQDKDDDSTVKAMNDELERLRVQQKFCEAWTWARLYGGAGILMVVDDGKELFEPMDLMSIREVKALTVLNRFELPTAKIINNLESPDFGKQELYDLAPRSISDTLSYGLAVHNTRVIRFDGMPLPRRLFEINDNWHDSVLPKILNALRNYNMAHDSMASALSDFRLMILKLKDLADMVGSDDDAALLARLQLMNMSKSILNSVAIDADSESIEHLDTNFSNLDKVLEKVEARLVADSDLPHTVVLGEGATGTLSGGGESEDRNAKGFVAAQQELVLTKPINRILEIIQAAKAGPFRGSMVEGLTWDFKPLWQMSEKEKADIHFIQAQADEKYFAIGALSPETISRSRFGGSEYSTETQMEEAFSEEASTPKVPEDKQGDPVQDYEEQVAYEHAHSGYIERVGYFYTSGANGEGDNHTHTMPNGVDTGPAIPLFGGGHMHQATTEAYTGPAFPLSVAKEAQAVAEEAKEEKPAMVELELDLKTGKFMMKTIASDNLQSVILDPSLVETKKLQARFDYESANLNEKPGYKVLKVRDASVFKSLKTHPTNLNGVKVVIGEPK